VQVTYGTRRPQLYSKGRDRPLRAANVAPGKALVEFRLTEADKTELKAGAEIKADLFKEGEAVDVTRHDPSARACRHHEASQLRRHARDPRSVPHATARRAPSASVRRRAGCSRAVACPVTWASCAAPPRNLRVVQVDLARNLLLIRGAVPGAEGGQVIVRPSLKAARRAKRKTVTPLKAGAAASKDAGKAERSRP